MQKSVENQHEVWLALAAQLEVDEKSAEEYIKQQYPIDMSQADCTDPEWKDWVDDVFRQNREFRMLQRRSTAMGANALAPQIAFTCEGRR